MRIMVKLSVPYDGIDSRHFGWSDMGLLHAMRISEQVRCACSTCIDHILTSSHIHYSDEPNAIIFTQVLALSHRAQVLTYSRSDGTMLPTTKHTCTNTPVPMNDKADVNLEYRKPN